MNGTVVTEQDDVEKVVVVVAEVAVTVWTIGVDMDVDEVLVATACEI